MARGAGNATAGSAGQTAHPPPVVLAPRSGGSGNTTSRRQRQPDGGGSGNATAAAAVATRRPGGNDGRRCATSNGGTATERVAAGGAAATGSGGTTSSSGAGNTAGGANPNAPDAKGKTNAKGGDMTSADLDYLKLGEMRLINNNWGSVEWACGTKSKENVFVSADKSSFGWNFDRGDCDTGNTNQKPDYPEIEFGIHPFGLGSIKATSPDFSTTTLLPKQLKDITEASVDDQKPGHHAR